MIGPCQRCGQERTLRKGILCHSCDQKFTARRNNLGRVFIGRGGRMSKGGTHKAPPVSLPVVRLP